MGLSQPLAEALAYKTLFEAAKAMTMSKGERLYLNC